MKSRRSFLASLAALAAAPLALLGLKRAAGGNPPMIVGDPNMPLGVWDNGNVVTHGHVQFAITPFDAELLKCIEPSEAEKIWARAVTGPSNFRTFADCIGKT